MVFSLTARAARKVRSLSKCFLLVGTMKMMIRSIATNLKTFLLLVATITVASAQVKVDKLKFGLKEYNAATISIETRLRAKIMHDAGTARVATDDLPEEVQRQLGVVAIAPQPQNTVIAVSQIKDPRELESWFERVAKQEKWNETSTITVKQTAGIGKLVEIDLSNDLVMLTGDYEDRADDSTFEAMVKDTGQTYTYTSVLGATKKVKLFSVQPPSTSKTFVKILKGGATYQLPGQPQQKVCDECGGRPIPCKTCGSTGIVKVDTNIEVKWT